MLSYYYIEKFLKIYFIEIFRKEVLLIHRGKISVFYIQAVFKKRQEKSKR